MFGRAIVFVTFMVGLSISAHAAKLPAHLEAAITKSKTVKQYFEALKSDFTADELKSVRELLGSDYNSKLPKVRRDADGGFTFLFPDERVRLIFGEPGSRRFTVNDTTYEVRKDESLLDALKRNIALARTQTALHLHPLEHLLLPRAHAAFPAVALLLAVIGTGGYIVYEKHAATETACDEFNTAVNSCNEPLRQMAALIRKCRRNQKPEIERQIRRLEARVRHLETRGGDAAALTKARDELKDYSNQLARNENPANPAPCVMTAEEREEDAFTGAESAASAVYWDVLSKTQNRGSSGTTRVMCANERRAMGRCIEELKKAGKLLNMDFMVDRVRGETPAAGEGRD